MRATAVLLSLAIVSGCGAPGTGGAATGTAAEAKQTLLAARLVDVRRGEPFALQDFGGKVVIVLGITVW